MDIEEIRNKQVTYGEVLDNVMHHVSVPSIYHFSNMIRREVLDALEIKLFGKRVTTFAVYNKALTAEVIKK